MKLRALLSLAILIVLSGCHPESKNKEPDSSSPSSTGSSTQSNKTNNPALPMPKDKNAQSTGVGTGGSTPSNKTQMPEDAVNDDNISDADLNCVAEPTVESADGTQSEFVEHHLNRLKTLRYDIQPCAETYQGVAQIFSETFDSLNQMSEPDATHLTTYIEKLTQLDQAIKLIDARSFLELSDLKQEAEAMLCENIKEQDCSSKPKPSIDQTIDSNEASEQLQKDFLKIAHFWWHKETTLKDKKKLVDAYLFLKQHTSALIPRMMLRFEGILYAVRNQTGKEYPAMQSYIQKIFEVKLNKGLKDTDLAWCTMEYSDAKATIKKREFYRNYHPHIKDVEALVEQRYQRICKKN